MQNSNSKAGTEAQQSTEAEVPTSSSHNAKPRVIRRLICFFNLWGTSNYYQGVDKPTVWQWLYTWRLSAKTAWKVSCIIWS